jgi:hypothetical protein
MGQAQVVGRCPRILLQQEGLDLFIPKQVNDLFMRQHRVASAYLACAAEQEHNNQQA